MNAMLVIPHAILIISANLAGTKFIFMYARTTGTLFLHSHNPAGRNFTKSAMYRDNVPQWVKRRYSFFVVSFGFGPLMGGNNGQYETTTNILVSNIISTGMS